MNRLLKLLVSALLVVAVVAASTFMMDHNRADAAPARSSQALLSSRSAGLVAHGGVVRLGAAGVPSREAATAVRAVNARPEARGISRAVDPNIFDDLNAAKDEMCNGIGEVNIGAGFLSVDVGGVLQGICRGFLGLVISVFKFVADVIGKIVTNVVLPTFRWIMDKTIPWAMGYDKDCGKAGVNVATNDACTGVKSGQNMASIKNTMTAKTIVLISLLMAFVIFTIAVISALLKLSLADLGKMLLRLPVVWIVSTIGLFMIAAGVGVRDGMVTFIVNNTGLMDHLKGFMTLQDGTNFWATQMQGAIQLVAFLGATIGAVLLFIVFVVGDIVIASTMLFIPMTAVGLIWSGTAKWFKRVVELSFAFIIGKVVVVGILALALELLDKTKGA
ncbi:MAG: hypothetical protein ACOYN3_09320 [Acidimicrobiia bacterium]